MWVIRADRGVIRGLLITSVTSPLSCDLNHRPTFLNRLRSQLFILVCIGDNL